MILKVYKPSVGPIITVTAETEQVNRDYMAPSCFASVAIKRCIVLVRPEILEATGGGESDGGDGVFFGRQYNFPCLMEKHSFVDE